MVSKTKRLSMAASLVVVAASLGFWLYHTNNLIAAVKHDRWPAVKKHLDSVGANQIDALVNVRGMHQAQGRAPLLVAAACYAADDVLVHLLEAGANVDAQDVGGHTALYYAIVNNDERSVRELLARNPDLNLGQGKPSWLLGPDTLAEAHANRMNHPRIRLAVAESNQARKEQVRPIPTK